MHFSDALIRAAFTLGGGGVAVHWWRRTTGLLAAGRWGVIAPAPGGSTMEHGPCEVCFPQRAEKSHPLSWTLQQLPLHED